LRGGLLVAAVHHAAPRGAERMARKPVPDAVLPLPAAAGPAGAAVQVGQRNRDYIPAVALTDGGTPSRRLGRTDTKPGIAVQYDQPVESLSYLDEYPLLSSLADHFWPSPSGSAGSVNASRSRTTALTDRSSVYAASRNRSYRSSGRSTLIRFMESMIPEIREMAALCPNILSGYLLTLP